MPLTKRAVSPVDVSRYRLPPNVRHQELECVSNGSLANLVRQLSSLSRHAEDIFGELYREAVKLEHKTNTLNSRVDRLALKVTQLDSNEEEVSLQDLHLRKPYKSNSLLDQQSLSRQTLPTAMTECYSQCDRPPELDKLNQYRDDDKIGLKFYTDPEYFFELWRKEMLKESDQVKKVRHPKPRVQGSHDKSRKRSPRQPDDHRAKYIAQALRAGEFIDLPAEYQTPELLRQQQLMRTNHIEPQIPPGMVRPESLEGLQQPNGQYSSGYVSSASESLNSAQVQQASMSQQHPRVSVLSGNALPTRQPQQQYGVHQQQTYQGVGRPVTSPYMVAGYGLQQRLDAIDTMNDVTLANPTSPGSSDSTGSRSRSGSRPSQPPPAPPSSGTPPPSQSLPNGEFAQKLGRMAINQNMNGPVYSNGVDDNVNSPDQLPPPPPPINTMADSIMSDRLPSPPPEIKMDNDEHMMSGIPPPPPPPPPGNLSNGNEQRSPSQKMAPKVPQPVDGRSDLLRAIRDGINLKKVDRLAQKEQELEAAKGHDVAAILRKRMEDVYGQSDTESDPEEWDDDWDD